MTSNYLKVGDLNVTFDAFKIHEGPSVSIELSVGPLRQSVSGVTQDGLFFVFQVKDKNLASYLSNNNLLLRWNGSIKEFYEDNLKNQISMERFKEVFEYKSVPFSHTNSGIFRGEVVFDILERDRNPKYVCYMGHPYVDYKSFMSNIGRTIAHATGLNYVAIGDITVKKILFQDHSLKTTAQYYQNSTTKQPWYGRVHIMPSKGGSSRPAIMSGVSRNERSVILEPKNIIDSRVIDMRITSSAKRILLNAEALGSRFYDGLKKQLDQYHEKYWRDNIEIEASYFSDIRISTDDSRGASLQFDFNLGSSNSYGAISEYASFPSPFEPGANGSSLVSKFLVIESVRVYRTRIKDNREYQRARETKFNLNKGLKMGSFHDQMDPYLFDLNDPGRELVAELYGDKQVTSTEITGVDKKNYIRTSNSAVPGIVQFFVRDNTVSYKSYGDYQYYTEIKVKDGSRVFLKSKLRVVEDSCSVIEEYHDKISFNMRGNSYDLSSISRQAREASLALVNIYNEVTGEDILENQNIHSMVSLTNHELVGIEGVCTVLEVGRLLRDYLTSLIDVNNSLKNSNYTNFNKYTNRSFSIGNHFTNESFKARRHHRKPYCKFIGNLSEEFDVFPVKQSSALSEETNQDFSRVKLRSVGFQGGEEVSLNMEDMTEGKYVDLASRILSGLETGGTENIFDSSSKDASIADLLVYYLGKDGNVAIRPLSSQQEKTSYTPQNELTNGLVSTREMNIGNNCFDEEEETTIQTKKRDLLASSFGQNKLENFYFPYGIIVKLAEASVTKGKPVESSLDIFQNYFSNLKTAKIKILIGYKMSNGRYLMNRPIWGSLDPTRVESGVDYICKIETDKDDIFGLETYNSIFILRSGTRPGRSNMNRGLFQGINSIGKRDFNGPELTKMESVPSRFFVEVDLPGGVVPRGTTIKQTSITPNTIRNRGSY